VEYFSDEEKTSNPATSLISSSTSDLPADDIPCDLSIKKNTASRGLRTLLRSRSPSITSRSPSEELRGDITFLLLQCFPVVKLSGVILLSNSVSVLSLVELLGVALLSETIPELSKDLFSSLPVEFGRP
jgi:hypothetical protein